MEEYKSLSSQVYQASKPVGHSINGDLEYYYQKLRHIEGPILEAGVGTGRLLIPYIEKGLDLEGVDLSQHMLKICQKNCQEAGVKSKLYHGDLADLKLDKKYEAIIMPTGSFCLITELERAKASLKSFKDHLTDEGSLILDLAFPTDFEKGQHISITELGQNRTIVLYSHNIGLDLVEQKTYSINKYEEWKDGKLVDTEIAQFNMVWYGINEFIYILKEVGFSKIDYEFGYGNENDKSIVTFIVGK